MSTQIELINKAGRVLFYSPTPFYDYQYLAKKSLAPNTYRGFHKLDKSNPGAKDIFEKIFLQNSKYIIDSINSIDSEYQLNLLEQDICTILKMHLKKNINNRQLTSYNKVRKPVDIFIEHLISMGANFSMVRKSVTKYLFLPLDSQMFRSRLVFSDREVVELNIDRRFTFKDISSESHYNEIQAFLKEKADRIGLKDRIFFDLIWNDRYKTKRINLFE